MPRVLDMKGKPLPSGQAYNDDESALMRAEWLLDTLQATAATLASMPAHVLVRVVEETETPMGKGVRGAACILRDVRAQLELARRAVESEASRLTQASRCDQLHYRLMAARRLAERRAVEHGFDISAFDRLSREEQRRLIDAERDGGDRA